MSRVLKSHPTLVVVLKISESSVPHFILRARSIVESVAASSWFPSPSPPLAEVSAAIDALEKAQVRTVRGPADAVPVRDSKRQAVMVLLEQLRDYVWKIALQNPEHAAEIVEAAGMHLKRLGGPQPQQFEARRGEHSGDVRVTAPRHGDRAAYEFQYSLNEKTWLAFPKVVETKARATLTGQKPGTILYIRYRVTVKGVTSNWSNAIKFIVT